MVIFSKEQFGERLKSLRKEKNIGQNTLAEIINVSNASISYWETGKQEPCATAICKIAAFFNVTTDYLLGVTDD